MQAFIAPSILSADFARLGFEGKRMSELGCDWLHVDVMDGHFVPNITLGAPIVKSLNNFLDKKMFLDVHLMVSDVRFFACFLFLFFFLLCFVFTVV